MMAGMRMRLFAGMATTCLTTGVLAAASPAEKGQTFETGGVTIYYEVVGAGRGRPSSWSTAARASITGTCIARTPGTGSRRTARSSSTTSAATAARARSRTASPARWPTRSPTWRRCGRSSGVEKIDLLGHSWGGYLVMAYAARHPERIAHLMIVDSAAPKIQDTGVPLQEHLSRNRDARGRPRLRRRAGRRDGDRRRPPRVHVHALLHAGGHGTRCSARSSILELSPEGEQVGLERSAALRSEPRAPEVPLPRPSSSPAATTSTSRPSVAWAIHRAIPGSEFAVFEKSGHLPLCEESDTFATRVDAFLMKR